LVQDGQQGHWPGPGADGAIKRPQYERARIGLYPVEEEIVRLQLETDHHPAIKRRFPARWLAVKLLEQDAEIETRLQDVAGCWSLPVLMSLYLALAILEDSVYMARAAFVMDRLMHALGLHGKSFLPMIVSFVRF
jgi:Fe2+ transport system protein B